MDLEFYKASEISKMFRLPVKDVHDMCNARGQKFAFRKGKRGNWKIDKARFEKYLERRMQA